MRPLEIVIIAILSLHVLSFFLKKEKRPAWLYWLPTVAAAILVLHAITEGIRWQMYIAYLLTFIYLAFSIKSLFGSSKQSQEQTKGSRIAGILSGVLVIVLLGASLLIANLLPVSEPFSPTGKHQIGTSFFHLIDYDRKEVLTADSSDVRSLWVQAWYPAETTKSFERVQVFSNSEKFMGDAFERVGWPSFMGSHVSLIKSHSYLDAPIKNGDEPFPVILFSHGYTGNLSSTPQIEELVSQGYVVFSIAHSYESALSLNQAGEWISRESFNLYEDNSDTVRINPIIKSILAIKNRADSTTTTDYLSPLALTENDKLQLDSLYGKWYPLARARLKIWAADKSFVLNEVEQMQRGEKKSIFKGKLDLKRVGAFGFSFGGGAAALFNSIDERCLAAANLDGLTAGMMYADTLTHPYMLFMGDYAWNNNLTRGEWGSIGNSNPFYRIGIKGGIHGNIPAYLNNFSLQSKIGLIRPDVIDQYRAYEIYNSFLVAFFDRHLKGKEQQKLLEGEERFEEVNFRVH